MTVVNEDLASIDALATIPTNDDLLPVGDAVMTRAEAADVHAFLDGERGAAWLKRRLDNAFYTRWWDSNRSPYDISLCNDIANDVIKAKQAGACVGEVEDAIEERFSGEQYAEDVYHEEHSEDLNNDINAIASDLDDMREEDDTIPKIDVDVWVDEIRDRLVEHMNDNDDSSVMDMFSRHDRCEIMFRLGGPDEISSSQRSADFNGLVIDEALQRVLAATGYTVGDYRRMTGNRTPSDGRLGRFARRRNPLLDEKELRQLVNNSCSTNFALVVYAIVTVKDLVKLDLGQPVSLSGYSIATYDAMNGTFFDIRREEAITFMPGEVQIMAPPGCRPEDICGLHRPNYYADLANAT